MRRFIPLLSVALLAACSTPAEEPQPPHFVALGDSYAAMGSTTLPLDPPNTCVRAQDSYPELAAKEMDAELTNVACQGASTLDVLSSAGEHPAQVDALREDTDLVSLSIGGNDASFVRLTQCATDDICQAESGAQIDLEIRDLPRRLDKVYEEIHRRSPNAKILATGYLPLIKRGETCPYIEKIPASDREWLAGSIERINQAVREAAERNGATYVLADAALDHTACSPSPWVDFTGKETNSFPMHPTHAGQVAMAQALSRAAGR